MSEANAISDLERAEHLNYADGKGVKRISIYNDGVQVNASTAELQATLNSLTETIQELNQRMAFLGSIKQHQTESLRVTALTGSTTAVTGSLTSAGTVTSVGSITNFGTGIPASEMAHDINNSTAIAANINNVVVTS